MYATKLNIELLLSTLREMLQAANKRGNRHQVLMVRVAPLQIRRTVTVASHMERQQPFINVIDLLAD